MEEEDFKLSWSSYSEHVSGMLSHFLSSNLYADVTLVCADKTKLEAHRLVLSMCSNFFKDILSFETEGKLIIYLKGIDGQEMQSILQFMYIGETTFPQSRTSQFLKVASDFELKALFKTEDDHSSQSFVQDSELGTNIGKNDENMERNLDMHVVENAKDNYCASEKKDEDKKQKLVEYMPAKESNILHCLSCNLPFNSRTSLKQHCSKEHKFPNVCIRCGFQATSKKNLKNHQKLEHKFLSCNKCEYLGPNKHKLLIHEVDAHQHKQFQCDLCSWSGLRRQFYKHKSINHDGKKISNIHGTPFVTESDLKKHGEGHIKDKIACNDCEFTCYSSSNLESHKLFKHLIGPKFEQKVSDSGKLLYSCKECNYDNHRLTNMNLHIKGKHLGIQYYCDQCEHSFTQKGGLATHIRAVHNKEYKFSCKQCNKTFKYYSTYVGHIGSEHQNIIYKCKLCNSTFTQKSNFNRHNKKYHS